MTKKYKFNDYEKGQTIFVLEPNGNLQPHTVKMVGNKYVTLEDNRRFSFSLRMPDYIQEEMENDKDADIDAGKLFGSENKAQMYIEKLKYIEKIKHSIDIAGDDLEFLTMPELRVIYTIIKGGIARRDGYKW